MNILVDILHIPQLNFYSNMIKVLSGEGHHIYVTVLSRGRLSEVAKKELGWLWNIEIEVIGRHRMTALSAILDANLYRFPKLLAYTRHKKIDLAFSNGYMAALIGRINRFPVYTFEDDPGSMDGKLHSIFATQNFYLLGDCRADIKLRSRDFLLPVLKEWAYLSPAYFTPDIDVLDEYAVEPGHFLFLREVSVGTINYSEQANGAILGIKNLVPKEFKILLSLENKNMRNLYPDDWILLQEPLKDVHSLIYYSAGLVSSGDSMAREAALLGVPSYYLGVRFSMPANAAAAQFADLQNSHTMPFEKWVKSLQTTRGEQLGRQCQVRDSLTHKFMDINELMCSLVKNNRK